MKNVLFLIYTPRFSGAEIVIKNLIQNNNKINSYALVGEDYKSKISKNDIKTKYIQKLERESISTFAYIRKIFHLSFGLMIYILKLQRKYEFDIFFANNLTLASYGLLTKIIFAIIYPKVKFIWYDYNLNYKVSKCDKWSEKTCNVLYHNTIVASNAVYNKTKQTKSNKIVLYSGIDKNIFNYDEFKRKKMRAKFSLENKIILGIFGTISEHKGHLKLLEAFRIISKKYVSVHLIIVGDFVNSFSEDIIYKVVNNIEKGRVTISSKVDNIHEYYSLIDILVNNTSATLSEPFGTTILEGMASENIVIASLTGGTSEIIDDRTNGFLFEPDNIEDLISKIEHVINNIAKLQNVRKNARQKIIQKFSIERMLNSFNEIIGVE